MRFDAGVPDENTLEVTQKQLKQISTKLYYLRKLFVPRGLKYCHDVYPLPQHLL